MVDAAADTFSEQVSLCEDLLPRVQKNGSFAMLVLNKVDLAAEHMDVSALPRQLSASLMDLPRCTLSCKTQAGLEDFLESLTSVVKTICGNPLSGNPSLTQARHRQHLQDVVETLRTFHDEKDLMIAVSSLQVALQHIGKITGKVCTEDILDVIFRDFCIGK
eukprot:scpid47482/ scgid28732/ tRNA modification GTPase GTPBP3, mitochondrial; GTP-binding protein 3